MNDEMESDRLESEASLAFSQESEREFQQILGRYPNTQAVVLPALHLAQKDFGYISVKAMEYVARRLDLPPSKVLNTTTFYEMFNRYPRGKYQIRVCTGPSCSLLGAERILETLKQRLGIKLGQTTPDRRFTLLAGECLASCGTGPMLECNGRYYENLTPDDLEQLLARWSEQKP